VSRGAQPSSTLARLLKGKGSKDMERYIQPMADRKAKASAEGEAAPAAVASAKPEEKAKA